MLRDFAPSPASDTVSAVRRLREARILRFLFAAFTVAAASIAAYYALILTSPTEVTVGPLRVEFSVTPSWHGKSIVDIPPAGSIEADTHSGPAIINYSLKEIAVDDIGGLTDPGSEARIALDNWRDPVGAKARSLIFKVILATMLTGGAVAGLLQRRWRWAFAGMAVGLGTALAVGGLAYGTYDTAAFSEPRYSGGLAYAPDVLAFSQDTLANLDAYEDRVPEIADSLYRTISELHQLPQAPPEDGSIRVLHISDMHSSAAAARLTKNVVDLYKIDFVIDTGDLTDLGTSLEVGYPSTYLPLPVPYIWVAGNHDTPTITRTMQSIPGVTVLDGQFTTEDGIVVGGFPDPASRSASPQPSNDIVQAQEALKIAALVDSRQPRPFIAAVHDPKQAGRLDGKVAVVVDGHTHRQDIEVRSGTVFLDAGSTGGGGFRSFGQNGESPSSLQVLYIRKEPQKLMAVDTITIYGFSQEFSVTRRVFAADEGVMSEVELREALAAVPG